MVSWAACGRVQAPATTPRDHPPVSCPDTPSQRVLQPTATCEDADSLNRRSSCSSVRSRRPLAFDALTARADQEVGDATEQRRGDALAGRRVFALPRSVTSSPLAAASFLFLRLKRAIWSELSEWCVEGEGVGEAGGGLGLTAPSSAGARGGRRDNSVAGGRETSRSSTLRPATTVARIGKVER